MENPSNKMGNDGFYWFMGVVECTSDPEKLGRVQVRILGDHTQDKSEIPTASLPWAMPMMPVTTASMNGIGNAPIGLVQGSWVMGFYRDGQDKQQPIIMGSIGGVPSDASSTNIGFNDPIGCFPMSEKLEEPDTNRLARGTVGKFVNEPVSVSIRKENILIGCTSAATQWSEPITPYAPVYPYNYVWEGFYNFDCDGCNWGHIEEWDSTPGSERYFRQHKSSQNFLEIHPDGKEVRKIYGDGFEIDLMNKHLYVQGDYRVTIMGNKDEHIKGDYWQHIEGDHIQVIDKQKIQVIRGDSSTDVYGETVLRSKGSILTASESSCIRTANNDINDSSGGKVSMISVQESSIATGTHSSVTIPVLEDVSVSSEGYSSIILSCKNANSTKVSISSSLVSEIPASDSLASSVANTQVKIKPNSVYIDSPVINTPGDYLSSASVQCAGAVNAGGSISAGGGISAAGSISTSGLILASGPAGYDSDSGHSYLAVSPGATGGTVTPTTPSTTNKASINNNVNIPEEVYSITPRSSGFDSTTGEIHKCK